MKETIYNFRVDKQSRVLISRVVREVYGIDGKIYVKLRVIEGVRYIQISGYEIEFYQAIIPLDSKGRFILIKEIKEKLGIKAGMLLLSYEEEIDVKKRALLLKVSD